jgi:drug/metabolite transporter (DMT)-like permease
MSNQHRSMLAMAAFVGLWAAVEALAGQVLRKYSPYQVVFTRYVVHMALMVVVWGWRDPRSLVRTRRLPFQLGRSLLMLAMPASWIISTQHGVDGKTLMSIFWLSPLLMVGFASVLLGERVPTSIWVATIVACAGALAFIAPSRMPTLGPSLLFPLGMALSFSLYVVATRSLRHETMRANLFYTAFGVAAALALVMPRLWVTPDLHDLFVMVGVGVFGFAALYACDRMTATSPVYVSAPFAYLQLAFTVAIEAGMHGARPALRALAGLGVVGLALLFVWTRPPRSLEATTA